MTPGHVGHGLSRLLDTQPLQQAGRPVGGPVGISWKGWSLAPHPEGTWTPALWGCVGLLPSAVAWLWTLYRPDEAPPSLGPGLQGCSSVPLRPRAISSGRGKRAVASACPPPHHDGPGPPTAWATEQPQACPPEAGQELHPSPSPAGRAGPQREAWGLRAGGPSGLGCCTHCPPLPSPASGDRKSVV